MEGMRKELETLKSGFKRLEEKKVSFFKEFGNFLLTDEVKTTAEGYEELAEIYKKIKAIEDEKIELQTKIQEINTILAEKKVLEDQRKETREAIRELEKANVSLYENMGRSGYLAYQEGLLKNEAFSEVFLTLETEKEKINTFEVELKKTGSKEAGFFKKIMNRSREVYLKSNQNLKIRNLVKVYQKAGESLSLMEGIPWEDNDSLKHAFLPYYKNKEKQNELVHRDEDLSSSEATLRDRMEVLDIQRNSGKRVQELVDGIALQDEELEQEKFFLGQSWWKMDKKKQKETTIPSELKKNKSEIDKKEALLFSEQEILERKILQKELLEKLSVHEKERQRLENRLNQVAGDLERKKSEIAEIENELKSLGEVDSEE